nr:hypothetical protein [Geothrix sp. 21YS21S-2]
MNLIKDHQAAGQTRQKRFRVRKLDPVRLGFQIKVDGAPHSLDFPGEGGFPGLPGPEQSHCRHVVQRREEGWLEVPVNHCRNRDIVMPQMQH